MLAKLLKYELKTYGSSFLILCLVTILSSIPILSFFVLGSPAGMFQDVGVFLAIIMLSMLVAVFIYLISFMYTSFANLYKGKATFELMVPATPAQHIVAKLIASAIWALIGIFVFILCGVLFGFSVFTTQNMELISFSGRLISENQLLLPALTQFGAFLVSFTLGYVLFVAIMFAAISIGYVLPKFNDVVAIVLLFVGGFIQEHIFWLFAINPNFNDLTYYTNTPPNEIFSQILSQQLIFWVVMAVSCVMWALIAWLLFSQRFNVRQSN